VVWIWQCILCYFRQELRIFEFPGALEVQDTSRSRVEWQGPGVWHMSVTPATQEVEIGSLAVQGQPQG
jgi:hypothetical protein